MAADSIVLPERGKADTRSGRTTGSTAGCAAPELVFGVPKTSHGAGEVVSRKPQRQTKSDGCCQAEVMLLVGR